MIGCRGIFVALGRCVQKWRDRCRVGEKVGGSSALGCIHQTKLRCSPGLSSLPRRLCRYWRLKYNKVLLPLARPHPQPQGLYLYIEPHAINWPDRRVGAGIGPPTGNAAIDIFRIATAGTCNSLVRSQKLPTPPQPALCPHDVNDTHDYSHSIAALSGESQSQEVLKLKHATLQLHN